MCRYWNYLRYENNCLQHPLSLVDWNTASTTQPRNGEFAAAPFSNAVGGSVGNGNCSNQQQLSHQSVTGWLFV